jgi:uncharacterized protein (DUF362 family)
MDACDWTEIVQPGAHVILKPNLTCLDPTMAYAANTSMELLVAVVQVLQQRTRNILVGESDMINAPHTYSADLAFEVNGLYDLAKQYNFELINWSKAPTRPVASPLLAGFEMPASILDADVLISLPVLKTHAQTYYTGAMKNLWGCIPRYDRFLLHKRLHERIVEVNRILKPKLAIMDAIVGIEGRGPTYGIPRQLDLILGSRDLVALDTTAMRLVNLDPLRAYYVRLAYEAGLGQWNEQDIQIDGDFSGHKTIFKPAHYDVVLRMMDYLSPQKWFVRGVLLNPQLFTPLRAVSRSLRRLKVIQS